MAKSLKILVTGANGQLGHCLQKVSTLFSQFDCHFLGREHLPIDNHLLSRQVLDALKPDIVINAAAYTAVDRTEDEPQIANNANGYAVGNLAKHCKEIGCGFIHISSDYVFNGQGEAPYKETDPTAPVNAYGVSKLLGEKLALQENDQSIIIRTSWVYSVYGNNFVKTMRRLMAEKEQISVVNDQFGSPTSAMDLANAIFGILQIDNPPPGIYHFSNSGVISWYQFAEAIKTIGKFNCKINPIPTSGFPTKAKRPVYSAMDCSKIQQVFGIGIRPWKDALQEVMDAF